MEARQFRNALATMTTMDRKDLVEAGVIDGADRATWEEFRNKPWTAALALGDTEFAALFNLIERRISDDE